MSDGVSVTAGILIGGRGARMGGCEKGLLEVAPGVTILDLLLRTLAELHMTPLLIGQGPATRARYPQLGALPDAVSDRGPAGGLLALLEACGDEYALLLGCDMPFVTVNLLDRLVHAPPAPITAPRRADRWEPLCARYRVADCLPWVVALLETKRPSLQQICDAHAQPLAPATDPNDDDRALADWDTPDDVTRGASVR